VKCTKISNESLRAFNAFRTLQVRAFTQNSSFAVPTTFEFQWGPIGRAPHELRSPTDTMRSRPIRRRLSMPGPGSRRIVDARPRSVLVVNAVKFFTSRAHPTVMETPAHEGMCQWILLPYLIVRLYDPMCRSDTSVSSLIFAPCVFSRSCTGVIVLRLTCSFFVEQWKLQFLVSVVDARRLITMPDDAPLSRSPCTRAFATRPFARRAALSAPSVKKRATLSSPSCHPSPRRAPLLFRATSSTSRSCKLTCASSWKSCRSHPRSRRASARLPSGGWGDSVCRRLERHAIRDPRCADKLGGPDGAGWRVVFSEHEDGGGGCSCGNGRERVARGGAHCWCLCVRHDALFRCGVRASPSRCR